MGATSSWGVLGTSKKSKWRVRDLPWIPSSGGGAGVYVAPLSVEGHEVEPVPDDSWTKQQIVDWLLERGVEFTESALMQMTKAELLALVADIVDEETDP